jgi:hypothetical protein
MTLALQNTNFSNRTKVLSLRGIVWILLHISLAVDQSVPANHALFTDVKFDDVDEADLALDEMNLGQSHRLRMKAVLDESHRGNGASARGGHTQRGGRGGSALRGRGNYSNSSRYEQPPNVCSLFSYLSTIIILYLLT